MTKNSMPSRNSARLWPLAALAVMTAAHSAYATPAPVPGNFNPYEDKGSQEAVEGPDNFPARSAIEGTWVATPFMTAMAEDPTLRFSSPPMLVDNFLTQTNGSPRLTDRQVISVILSSVLLVRSDGQAIIWFNRFPNRSTCPLQLDPLQQDPEAGPAEIDGVAAENNPAVPLGWRAFGPWWNLPEAERSAIGLLNITTLPEDMKAEEKAVFEGCSDVKGLNDSSLVNAGVPVNRAWVRAVDANTIELAIIDIANDRRDPHVIVSSQPYFVTMRFSRCGQSPESAQAPQILCRSLFPFGQGR